MNVVSIGSVNSVLAEESASSAVSPNLHALKLHLCPAVEFRRSDQSEKKNKSSSGVAFIYLTKLMCVPKPLWRAAQSMHMKIPWGMEAHVGFLTSQSKQTYIVKKDKHRLNSSQDLLYCQLHCSAA